ncbi:thermonuclease family protein [Sphingomonas sp. LT1P40]|uniref:thermonuclease family protein n=1 Tax=Alteristakelama amylovorans TaxID=3096166 RepID=UPI002FC83E53
MKHPMDLHRSRRLWREWDGRRTAFRRRSHSRWRFGRNELSAMLLAGITAGLAWTLLPADGDAATPSASVPAAVSAPVVRTFARCESGGGSNCVVDGDTFRMGGAKIRIADIDTPETHPARCAREAALGEAATARLHALLNSGGVTLHPIDRDTDRYGRLLRRVSVNGRGVGDTLVAEGLARRYEGGRRIGWC